MTWRIYLSWRAVGMSVAVADAADDVTAGADHVTQRGWRKRGRPRGC